MWRGRRIGGGKLPRTAHRGKGLGGVGARPRNLTLRGRRGPEDGTQPEDTETAEGEKGSGVGSGGGSVCLGPQIPSLESTHSH